MHKVPWVAHYCAFQTEFLQNSELNAATVQYNTQLLFYVQLLQSSCWVIFVSCVLKQWYSRKSKLFWFSYSWSAVFNCLIILLYFLLLYFFEYPLIEVEKWRRFAWIHESQLVTFFNHQMWNWNTFDGTCHLFCMVQILVTIDRLYLSLLIFVCLLSRTKFSNFWRTVCRKEKVSSVV